LILKDCCELVADLLSLVVAVQVSEPLDIHIVAVVADLHHC
jgi:hypothetical protein